MIGRLRAALEDLRSRGENEERKRNAIRSEEQLAHLVGKRRAREARGMLEEQGSESAELIEAALREQLELSRNLHGGRLGSVRLGRA